MAKFFAKLNNVLFSFRMMTISTQNPGLLFEFDQIIADACLHGWLILYLSVPYSGVDGRFFGNLTMAHETALTGTCQMKKCLNLQQRIGVPPPYSFALKQHFDRNT